MEDGKVPNGPNYYFDDRYFIKSILLGTARSIPKFMGDALTFQLPYEPDNLEVWAVIIIMDTRTLNELRGSIKCVCKEKNETLEHILGSCLVLATKVLLR